MQYIQTVPPAAKPLTLDELKAHLRVTHAADDLYITALSDAATLAVENHTFKQLILATWVLLLDDFPCIIVIDKVPLSSVTTIKYYDADNALQTFDAANYTVEKRTNPATIKLKPEKEWPETYSTINAIEITFIAGYASAAIIPDPFKHAMKLICGNLYTYRDNLSQKAEMTRASEVLLQPYTKPVI